MRINGRARLACNTKVADMLTNGDGAVAIEPAGNMGLIKDLIVQ